jgi:hypothetical protein
LDGGTPLRQSNLSPLPLTGDWKGQQGAPSPSRRQRFPIAGVMSHFEFLEGAATFTVVSTVAEAADGCGRGWYYNGRRCVPMDEPGYRYRGDYGTILAAV